MEKIYVPAAEVYKAIERDCGYRGRQHITEWWDSGDDIAFANNRKEWGAEHYNLIDFVAAICRHIPKVNAARCNQYGYDHGHFFFYRDEGATDCHTIPENVKTTERAYIRIEWRIDSSHPVEEYKTPVEVERKMAQCAESNPYMELTVLRKVDESEVPFGQRMDYPCEYWVISDEQMKRIEHTMWWRNQFAKVFDLDSTGAVRGYMDGSLYTETGRRILLASDAQEGMYTYSPAFAHVGAPNMEETHAERLV